MILDISYEQALAKATPALRNKIQHSVELLRKSEKLALKYKEDGFVVGFSGGKDSQTVYHLCQLAGVKHVGWFSPTSIDPSEVIRFIRQQYPEIKWTKLEMSIFEHSVRLGCLPTMRIRHCCAAFKENKHPNTVTIVGVRRAESSRRAKRNEVEVSGHKFSGDLDGFELWSEKKIEKMKSKIKNLNQDQFSDHPKESEIRCVGGKDSIIIMPILEWSDYDVWEFLNKVIEVPHCSLYDEGRRRIGCIMCPFSSVNSIYSDIKRWPHVYWKWVSVVKAIREGRTTLKNIPEETSEPKQRVSRGIWKEIEELVPRPNQDNQDDSVSTDNTQSEADTQSRNYYSKQLEIVSKVLPPPISIREPFGYKSSKDYYNQLAEQIPAEAHQLNDDERSKNENGIKRILVPSPTGKGYINTPEEMIVAWWISKLSFKEWLAKTFMQQKLDFDFEDTDDQYPANP